MEQYAATSHAETMRQAYGPYAHLFEKGGPMRQSLEDLEKELGIENLQIRMWPARAYGCNDSMTRHMQQDGFGQFDMPNHFRCAKHNGGQGSCDSGDVCSHSERKGDIEKDAGGIEREDVEAGRGGERAEQGGVGLKPGENPWEESRDGRGPSARWGTLLTIPERLQKEMVINSNLALPSLEVDIFNSGLVEVLKSQLYTL